MVSMRVLTLDAETFDPCLKKYGMGWCFKYHYPEVEFDVLMFGAIASDGTEYCFNTMTKEGVEQLWALMREHDALLFHNAAYDLGALRYLYRDRLNLQKSWIVLDTMLLAKLDNQSYLSYSLDNLTKLYGVTNKQSDLLHDYAWKSGIYQKFIKDETGRNRSVKPSAAVLEKFCKQDMRRFPWAVMEEYCLQDVRATRELFHVLFPRTKEYDLKLYSNVIKVCLDAKTNGMRIDLKAAKELSDKWLTMAEALKQEVLKEWNVKNIDSPPQVGAKLEELGINVPRTEKGNYSVTYEWLTELVHPAAAKLARYRKAKKAEKDFIQKLLQYQEAIPAKYRQDDIGWIYPSLKPLGATATGRFTSGGGQGCLELNMLAISGRDEEFGHPIRELFIPHEGEKIVVCDFSNQEPRLQVHYAKLLGCGGVDSIILDWHDNPNMKYHQKVADMTGLEYDIAKMVTLGLAYDMRAAGLSSKLNISFDEAKNLIQKYLNLMTFMKQLQYITAKNFLKLGYIRTIGGRKLYIDKAYEWGGKLRTQERKAMSKLIQGSGADQTIKAMVDAWEAGLKVLLSVHDEIIVSSGEPEFALTTLRNSMEQAYLLHVPVVADGGIGNNWREAK